MNLQRLSYLLGSLLLGVSAVLIFRGQASSSAARRKERLPVDKLAEPLQKAWEGYHNR